MEQEKLKQEKQHMDIIQEQNRKEADLEEQMSLANCKSRPRRTELKRRGKKG